MSSRKYNNWVFYEHKRRFRKQWLENPVLKDWLKKKSVIVDDKQINVAFCEFCNIRLRLKYWNLLIHSGSKRHMRNASRWKNLERNITTTEVKCETNDDGGGGTEELQTIDITNIKTEPFDISYDIENITIPDDENDEHDLYNGNFHGWGEGDEDHLTELPLQVLFIDSEDAKTDTIHDIIDGNKKLGKVLKVQNREKCIYYKNLPQSRISLLCVNCFKFEDNDTLKENYTLDIKSSRYRCMYCCMEFVHFKTFTRHFIRSHLIYPYSCIDCRKDDYNQLTIINIDSYEELIPLDDPSSYTCNECGMHYKRRVGIISHLSTHAVTSRYPCKYCAKEFDEISKMKKHEESHKKYFCFFCNKKFRTSSVFRLHLITHSGDSIHKCNLCGKRFMNHLHLKKHLEQHKENCYFCQICKSEFRTKNEFEIHGHDDKFKCKFCKEIFYDMMLFTIHVHSHIEEPKVYCHDCNSEFDKKIALRMHVKKHELNDVSKIISCEYCGKLYKRKWSVESHVAKHHSLEAYSSNRF